MEAVAVAFLHSYRNPAHEQRAGAILAEELPGIKISLSSLVDPEPKEYERSSTAVTDADLVLGHLDAASFLGGAMRLDRAAAMHAITERLAEPMGLGAEQAASGIHDLVNETMASAARMYVAEKGSAPSEVTMMAFGGAGPVHAVGLARKLGCGTVLIPPLPGVMSSLGLLVAPVAFERARGIKVLLEHLDLADTARLYAVLEAEARENMAPEAKPVVRRQVDLRYHGQDHALEVDVPNGVLDEATRAACRTRFIAAYRALYGKIDSDNPIEVAAIRVMLAEQTPPPPIPAPTNTSPAAALRQRKLWSSEGAAYVDAPVYSRAALMVGQRIAGPAIIEEREHGNRSAPPTC